MYRQAANVVLPVLALAASFSPCLAMVDSSTDCCPTIAPGPITVYDLDNILPSVTSQDVVAVDAIRNTLAQYPFAIDDKNFDRLDRVFTEDAVANYGAPIGVLAGLPAIKTIADGLAQFNRTHHSYGTQYIKICSPISAIAITYFTSSQFLTAEVGATLVPDTKVLYAYGQYQDTLAKQNDGTWKITYRNQVYQVSPSPLSSNNSWLISLTGSSNHRPKFLHVHGCA